MRGSSSGCAIPTPRDLGVVRLVQWEGSYVKVDGKVANTHVNMVQTDSYGRSSEYYAAIRAQIIVVFIPARYICSVFAGWL